MAFIKIGTAAVNQTPLDWEGNRSRIEGAILQAKKEGVSLLCLPELCITGYGGEDLFFSRSVQKRALRSLEAIAKQTSGIAVLVGLPLRHLNSLFNTTCLIVDGRIVGLVPKRFLANDGIHYEARWCHPWPLGVVTNFEGRYPIGDILFDIAGVRIGVEVCRDAWVAGRPGTELSMRGVDIILNPSASHFAFGKYQTRRRYITEASRSLGCVYAFCNLLGCESGRTIFEGDCAIASNGKMVAEGGRFGYEDWTLTTAVLDLEKNRLRQSTWSERAPHLERAEECVISDDFNLLTAHETPIEDADEKIISSSKNEPFYYALTLGLFDYLRKSKAKGFVVSLSGGVDSAAVAALVYLMVNRAWKELGREKFLARLGLAGILTQEQAVEAILCCVYQRTKNSSDQSQLLSKNLAAAIGATFLDFDVDPLAASYVKLAEKALGKPLSWEEDGLALQNIQARVRSPGAWLIANLRSAILLTTGNRSESSVGYLTMDGDSSGGFNPIGGVDKHFLRSWLRWIEKSGAPGCEPIAALAAINARPPSAELKPLNSGQTDEGDLMPYEVLDAIERLAINQKKDPLETFELITETFKNKFTARDLGQWTCKFYELWASSQWKRERLAPSFHVDNYNVHPGSGCRFPILSGNFTEEIKELRAKIPK
jgi:NAD+ synthase (glutamine-hydrolysing)